MLRLPNITLRLPPFPALTRIVDQDTHTTRCLDRIFRTSPIATLDDSNKIICFSDVHRGDNTRADAFADNEQLYLDALSHYFDQGYIYIEVGDGDELWGNRSLEKIRKAHARVFELLHQFYDEKRLFLVRGNHDVPRRMSMSDEKDGMVMSEGLVLQHVPSGRSIFVFHGHQADVWSDRFSILSRFLVRNVWTLLLRSRMGQTVKAARGLMRQLRIARNQINDTFSPAYTKIESRILSWAQPRHQLVLCGHTHRARMATNNALYLNTGQCVSPGSITGIEIHDGLVHLVRWLEPQVSGEKPRRELLAPPLSLRALLGHTRNTWAQTVDLAVAAD